MFGQFSMAINWVRRKFRAKKNVEDVYFLAFFGGNSVTSLYQAGSGRTVLMGKFYVILLLDEMFSLLVKRAILRTQFFWNLLAHFLSLV